MRLPALRAPRHWQGCIHKALPPSEEQNHTPVNYLEPSNTRFPVSDRGLQQSCRGLNHMVRPQFTKAPRPWDHRIHQPARISLLRLNLSQLRPMPLLKANSRRGFRPTHWSTILKGCVLVPRLPLRTRVYLDLALPKAIQMTSSVCRLRRASQLLQQAIQQPWLQPTVLLLLLLRLLLQQSCLRIIPRLPTNPASSPRQVYHRRVALWTDASLLLCRMHKSLPCPARRRFLQPLRRRSQKDG
jgi:hypothetical protein